MDEHQFKEKIIPLSSRLYSICHRVLGNSNDAKDCLQDVFLKLWTGRDSLESIRNIDAYATTVTRNLCLDRLRLKKNTVPIEKAVFQEDINEEPRFPGFTEERLDMLNWALKQLNEMQVRVFTMRDIERKEYDEIASELGINQENVRVILSRARKRIREIVEHRSIKTTKYYE
jgi:RNA polymerase sigma factor (sigma-70 family)